MINSKYIAKIRKNNGWSQEEMAGVLGVSRPTYTALEKGTGDITVEQLSKLANKLGCEPGDILSENITDEEKYKEVLMGMIKNGADSDGRITKTKLAKLIYLADFAWYYQNLDSMTGARYRKLEQGPVPNYYFAAIDDLIETGYINLEMKRDCQLLSLTEAGKMRKTEKVNDKEENLIKQIAKKWQGKRSQEIVKFTHEQLPYKICNSGEVIPYELITQQDPEDVY
jgi:transcriptional regulator with XRE-family HTH domain